MCLWHKQHHNQCGRASGATYLYADLDCWPSESLQGNVSSVPAVPVEMGRGVSVGTGVLGLAEVPGLVPEPPASLPGRHLAQPELGGGGPGYRPLVDRLGQV